MWLFPFDLWQTALWENKQQKGQCKGQGFRAMKRVLLNYYLVICPCTWECTACVHASHSTMHLHIHKQRLNKKVKVEQKPTLYYNKHYVCANVCSFWGALMFMYQSMEDPLIVHGRSCISSNISNYIRLTSTRSVSGCADTNNSCRVPSHQPWWKEQPSAIIMSSSIPMFSRLEMPGIQLSAVQKCPGCALPWWQDHSGLQAASSYKPLGLGYLLYMDRLPVSSVCMCMFLYESAMGPSYPRCGVCPCPIVWN